ncbi:ABC transporter substrate-binding protein [Streptomyces uncialis]|uniref:ABC transporter substrate-binding protein n=1 Tax=Streptomyces uncialis TaxID=1048205 RepID=UPI00380653F6
MPAVAAVALMVTLAMSGCGASGEAAVENGLTVVKVVKPSAASDNLALTLAINQGTFKKHGLKVTLVSAPQVGSNQIASLLNGQLDVGIGAVTSLMTAVTKGVPVRVVSAVAADNEQGGRPLYDTLVAPDSGIKSFKDLVGRTVAVNSLKSTWQASMSEAITKDGGDPAKVKYVPLTFPNQVPALKNGHVDAISTTQPFATQLIEQGFRSIGDAQAKALNDPHGVATIIQMSQAFIDKNPDAVAKFVTALQEGSDFANANPTAVRELAVEQAGASGDAAAAITASPLPLYTTKIDAKTIETWGALQTKYGFDKRAPSPSDVLWK